MPETAKLGFFELGLIAGSLAAWWWIIVRWQRGTPPLPREPHAEVRWDFADVLVALLVYFAVVQVAAFVYLNDEAHQPAAAVAAAESNRVVERSLDDQDQRGEKTSQHPVIQLLAQDGSAGIVLLVFFVAAVSAPLWEEFFFRLILLGWMAKQERIWTAESASRIPRGLIPLVITSLAFAMMHFRQADALIDPDYLVRAMKVTGVTNFASLTLVILYLRLRYQVSAAELGLSTRHVMRDLQVAAVGFLVVAVPLLFLQFILKVALPSGVAPDPIPLFFLALVFGVMYLRSGRITSCVLLHAMLNAFSLFAALAFVHAGQAAQ